MRFCRHSVILFAFIPYLTGCGNSADEGDGELKVAVSIIPQQWLVEQIGGDQVDVIALVQPGESPATFQPTESQISRLMQSKVYFRIGVPFENGKWFSAIESAGTVTIVDTRNDIALREIEAHSHGEEDGHEHDHHEHGPECAHGCDHSGGDPHIWLSLKLLKKQGRTVTDALSKHAPEHEKTFEANFEKLKKQLDETDLAIFEKLAPLQGKAFFVYHPAWGYFADAYGLTQVAIEQEGKTPSDQELTKVQKLARERGAKVVFVQPQISDASAQAVADAIGGEVKQLDPLAKDVPQNLLHAADALVEALSH